MKKSPVLTVWGSLNKLEHLVECPIFLPLKIAPLFCQVLCAEAPPVPVGEGEAEAGDNEDDEDHNDAGQVDGVQVQSSSSCRQASTVILLKGPVMKFTRMVKIV